MKWISVRDRLPEEGRDVLLFKENMMYIVKFYVKKIHNQSSCNISILDSWMGSYIHSDFKIMNYDYWMPLPKGPDEDEDEMD